MRCQRSNQPGSTFGRLYWIGFNIPANIARRNTGGAKHPQHDMGEILTDSRALLPHGFEWCRIIRGSRLVAKLLVNRAIEPLQRFAQRSPASKKLSPPVDRGGSSGPGG